VVALSVSVNQIKIKKDESNVSHTSLTSSLACRPTPATTPFASGHTAATGSRRQWSTYSHLEAVEVEQRRRSLLYLGRMRPSLLDSLLSKLGPPHLGGLTTPSTVSGGAS